MSVLDNLPLTRLKLNVALREHRLDEELDERGLRLRLLAIERELERQDLRIEALARNRYHNRNLKENR
ncbi:hypothetical protein [Collinsella aerofaciens]|uniref:hypothetical protein n=1 Tax=Collinsella aerofaciens TaxID=74426 RepID=UPI003568E0DB